MESMKKSNLNIENTEESNNWLSQLKNYLFNDLLKRLVSDDTQRAFLVNNEAMKLWEPIFTHSSYDRTIGKNYESLELLGDRFLDANFVLYLLEKHLYNISASELTEIKRFYMSKIFQAQLARNLQMDRYVRARGVDISTNIAEDIFEAFAGGLIRIGNLLKNGVGNILVFNFIVYLFKDIQIDYSVAKGHPKTQVKEIYDKLHWGDVIETVRTGSDNSQIVSISLTPEAIKDLARFGVVITNPILAQESSWTKKGAIPNAYFKALKVLNSMGITDLWISQRQIAEDMSNSTLAPLLQRANEKMKKEGYISIIFDTLQTNRAGKIMQLIGITPNGQQTILVETPERIQRVTEGKQQLLNLYLQGV